jgi:thiamine biosynthesis protein ThiI
MYTTILLNIDELWLKGKNRKLYFEKMKSHIRSLANTYHSDKFSLTNEQQRLALHSDSPFSETLFKRLQDLPGLNSIQPVVKTSLDLKDAAQVVVADLKEKNHLATFKVKAKRINKKFSPGSQEINRIIATEILKNTHFKVDVTNPDILLDVKVMNDCIYISWEKYTAVGGLPVNTSGHCVTLISGGFDSPVASYMMSKRGCKQTFIFFYAYPYVGEEVKEKIVEICQVLSRYQNGCKLYVVPFGEFQNYIAKECREDYRTLLFRKYMIDVASYLAYKSKAQSLVMGDALSQVSSQTMHNMSALDSACKRLVLRPLVGMNKIEIISKSQEIGTHDISIRPHDDACSLFAPKHPVTRPDYNYWEEFIKEHGCYDLVKKAYEEAEVYAFDLKGDYVIKS